MIRVAVEGSFQGASLRQAGMRGGIYRSTTEMLRALARERDIELSLVAMSETDVLKSSIMADQFASSFGFRFSFTAGSRLGLEGPYRRLFFPSYQPAPSRSAIGRLTASVKRSLFWRIQEWRIDRLTSSLSRDQFDVYHSTYPALPTPERTGGLPRILTIHDLIPVRAPHFVSPGAAAAFQRTLASIDRDRDWIVTGSEHTRDEICETVGIAPDRVAVAPLAADEFHPADDEAIADVRRRYGITGRYLLSISTFEPRKNLAHLIRCFTELLDREPKCDLTLVLTGARGWSPADIIEAASATRLKSRLIMTGFAADEDLSALYSGALAFIYPSLYEGFGLPPLEAMKCGAPVIASKTTSLPEVVGEAGIMIDPGDSEALIAAIQQLASSETLRSDLRRRGFERSSRFTWRMCAEQTAALYHRAVLEQ